jgi:hypothetical protein
LGDVFFGPFSGNGRVFATEPMSDQPVVPPLKDLRNGADAGELAARARRQPPNEDLLVRAAAGARMLEDQKQTAQRKARFRRFTAVTVAAAMMTAIAAWVIRSQNNQPLPSAPAPRSVGAALQGEQVTQTHIQRKVIVSLGERGSFAVNLFFLDQNRFLKNQSVLTNQPVLREALTSIQGELAGKWTVILAGASFEGDGDTNLNLTRRRVVAMIGMLKQVPGIDNNRFWQLPVGEYRELHDSGRELAESEEDARARGTARNNLPKQRQLVLIAIDPNPVRDSALAQSVVAAIVAELQKAGLVPTNYDHGASSPAPL